MGYLEKNARQCDNCGSDGHFTITIGSKVYCRRSGNLYVNPDSTEIMELGTVNYPYKTLESAFIEVWNYWTDPA